MVKWEFAIVNLPALHSQAKHSAAHNLSHPLP